MVGVGRHVHGKEDIVGSGVSLDMRELFGRQGAYRRQGEHGVYHARSELPAHVGIVVVDGRVGAANDDVEEIFPGEAVLTLDRKHEGSKSGHVGAGHGGALQIAVLSAVDGAEQSAVISAGHLVAAGRAHVDPAAVVGVVGGLSVRADRTYGYDALIT